jgi:hypothetical protein
MGVVFWFLAGLILVGGISFAVFRWYQLKSAREEPLPPEKLPKAWNDVMPKEKRPTNNKKSSDEPSFRRVGVKKRSNGLLDKLK